MDILFVATELAPTVKVGGLGDVVSSLKLSATTAIVTIALPRYLVRPSRLACFARRLTPPGRRPRHADGSHLRWPLSPSRGRLLDAHGARREHLRRVMRPVTASTTATNRSPAASRPSTAVSSPCSSSASPPADLRHRPRARLADGDGPLPDAPELARTRSVLTIHNLAHQSFLQKQASRDALTAFGLGNDHFTPARLEFYGGVSLLKGGILAADAVTTVSPTYAREILEPARGERLDGVLRARFGTGEGTKPGDSLLGILNGIDYASWNPATDATLPARFDADDPSNKARVKSTVLAGLGLSIDPERPLFVPSAARCSKGAANARRGCFARTSSSPAMLPSASTCGRRGERIKVLRR
jgi:starch synthase